MCQYIHVKNDAVFNMLIVLLVTFFYLISATYAEKSEKKQTTEVHVNDNLGRSVQGEFQSLLNHEIYNIKKDIMNKTSIYEITKRLRKKCKQTTDMSHVCESLKVEWGSKLPAYIKEQVINNTDNSKIIGLMKNGILPQNNRNGEKKMSQENLSHILNLTNHKIETNIPQPEILYDGDISEKNESFTYVSYNKKPEMSQSTVEIEDFDYDSEEGAGDGELVLVSEEDKNTNSYDSIAHGKTRIYEDENKGSYVKEDFDELSCEKALNVSLQCSHFDNIVINIAEWLLNLTHSYFRTNPDEIEVPGIITLISTAQAALQEGVSSKSRTDEDARGKLKKYFNNVSLLVLFKVAAIGAIALGAIKLVAGKALVIASISLVLAAAFGFKKLSGGSGKAVVIHKISDSGNGYRNTWNDHFHGHDTWDPQSYGHYRRESDHLNNIYNNAYNSYYKPEYDYELDKGSVTSYYNPQTIS